jgi:N-acetylneuraminic acid mutarotase
VLRRLLSIAVGLWAAGALIAAPVPASARPSADHHRHTLTSPFRAISAAAVRAAERGTAGPAASWTNLADMKVAVAEMGGAAVVGNRLYVPGGYRDYDTPTLYSRMQIYNITTNTWKVDSQVMPYVPVTGNVGWAESAVCSDGAKVYVVGGSNGSNIYSTMQVYDPSQPLGSRWSVGTQPVIGGDHGLVSMASGCAWIQGKMYVFGGYGVVTPASPGDEHILSLTWVYNPTTDTWSNTNHPIQGTPAVWFGYTGSSGKAFFAGGTADLTTHIPSPLAEVFSPATGWKRLPDLPTLRGTTEPGLLGPGLGMLGTTVEVFGGGGYDAVGGTFIVQSATLQCAPGCTSWTSVVRTLNTARWFAAYTYRAGGGTPTLYVAGGGPPDVITKLVESTT